MKNGITAKKTVIFLFFLFFVFGQNSISAEVIQNLTETQITSLPKTLNQFPSIAINNSNIHIVWEQYNQNTDNGSIHYISSFNKGYNWNEQITISSDTNSAYHPTICCYKSNIHVAWIDYQTNFSEIFYTKSVDNGNSWIKPIQLTNNSVRKTYIYDLTIHKKKENIFLIWKDYRSGSSEVFIKRSIDNGDTWKEDQRLTHDYTPSYSPSFTIQDNYCFIAYEDGGTKPYITFLKSIDSGNSWSEKQNITDKTVDTKSEVPDILMVNNIIYLVYQDDTSGNREIYFTKSHDLGNSWDKEKLISNESVECINSKIYAFDNNLIIFWQEIVNSSFNIAYSFSLDNGNSWSQKKYLFENKDCYDIKITGDNEDIFIVYQDYKEAGWGDISFIAFKLTDEKLEEDYSKDNTPGFGFNIFILVLAFVSLILYYNKKGVSKL